MKIFGCPIHSRLNDDQTGYCVDCDHNGATELVGFMLTIEEAQSIVNELGKTFIDRDNPLCHEVLNKMINFLRQHEQLAK